MAQDYDNVADELEALINGDIGIDATEEDTDLPDDSETDTDTNESDDGHTQDTDDVLDDDDRENTLVDDGDTDDVLDEDSDESDTEDENESDEVDEENTDTDNTEENQTDPESEADVAKDETDEVDYQKEYQELLEKSKVASEFYDKVAGAKFKANGKEVEGFKDPEKLIQAQQLAYNYSAKMAGFKQYRPFMAPLKERGILENPEKFDLAMKIIDGDPEALKQHMKNLEIDPVDFDMEDVKYEPTVVRSTNDMLAIEDAMDQARMAGVDKEVYQAVVKDWDDDSFKEFVDNPAVQKDLIEHVSNGSYDIVMQKVEQMSVLDPRFASQKMTDKYRAAIQQLNAEHTSNDVVAQETPDNSQDLAKKQLELDRIELEKKAAEIEAARAELEKARKNEAANKARAKAAAVSKSKPKANGRKKAIDPLELDGVGMSKLLDQMIMGNK